MPVPQQSHFSLSGFTAHSAADRPSWLRDFLHGSPALSFAYLLLDQRHLPDKERQRSRSLQAVPEAHRASLWAGTSFAGHADIAPLLIDLSGGDMVVKAVCELLENSEIPHWAFALYCSPHPFAEVAAHLAVFKDYAAVGQSKEFVLHLADSRVLERMPQAFRPDRWEAFMAPFAEVAYLSREGAEVRAAGPSAAPVPLPSGQDLLMLSAQEHQALIDLALPDKLTGTLTKQHSDEFEDVGYPDLYQRVETALVKARKHGLSHEIDLEGYVKAYTLLGTSFDLHPTVTDALRNAQAPGDFADALRNLPGEILEQMIDRA